MKMGVHGLCVVLHQRDALSGIAGYLVDVHIANDCKCTLIVHDLSIVRLKFVNISNIRTRT